MQRKIFKATVFPFTDWMIIIEQIQIQKENALSNDLNIEKVSYKGADDA